MAERKLRFLFIDAIGGIRYIFSWGKENVRSYGSAPRKESIETEGKVLRKITGIKRVAVILMAAVMVLGLTACEKKDASVTSTTVSTSTEQQTQVSADTQNVTETSASGEEESLDPSFTVFVGVLNEYGFDDSECYEFEDNYINYYDIVGLDFFLINRYEDAETAKANSVNGKQFEGIFEIKNVAKFEKATPCTVTTYIEGGSPSFEIFFDKYLVRCHADYYETNVKVCRTLLLMLCATDVTEEEILGEVQRKVVYEVEPEGTQKVFRLSSGTNVNNYNDSVFYIPAVPGLVAVDPYDEAAPLVGETELCSPNRIYFKNQYGDWIMLVDYNRDSNGYNTEGEAFDYIRIGDTDISDMTLVDRINTNIGAFNAEVLIRDYEDKNNADLKKEVTFILPAWKVVFSQKNRVESLSITYRCATVREAFEFVEKYLANDIDLEHAINNSEVYMHKLSTLTTDWVETYRNSPATIKHVATETVDWKEYLETIEPSAE